MLGAASCFATADCGGSSSSSTQAVPASSGSASVRFVDGVPSLETVIGSAPQDICPGVSAPCFLQVNGQSVSQLFSYGSITPFVNVTAGTLSLVARDEAGFAVGPLKTPSLSGGNRYTLIVVGTYPSYSVLAFEEPQGSGTQLSLYEASPSVRSADFGSFSASSRSNFKKLGHAQFGSVATVPLGKSVTNFGGYAGTSGPALGALTLQQIDSFDSHNALPFHRTSRLSLFLFDPKTGSANGPVVGSMDR